jgi:hypothetical protein
MTKARGTLVSQPPRPSHHQPAATALARLSEKRLQTSARIGKAKVPIGRLSDWLDVGEEQGTSSDVPSTLRQMEQGVLQAPKRLEFYLTFERVPLWLLALDAEIVNHVWILGFATLDSFKARLTTLGVNERLFLAAIDNIDCSRVSYSLLDSPKPGAVLLASGSLEFVRHWSKTVSNPLLVLCDEHIRSRQLRGTNALRWLRLRHQTFGGVTEFQAILGTNIPQFEPVRTTLRRTIQHVLDYGIKPSWAKPPGLKSTDLTLNDRLHPDHLATPVLYHTHYSATGWGVRPLSVDEVGIAFGLPAWARLASLTLENSFPMVPIQIMDGCLKGILSTVPKVTPLKTPAPQTALTACHTTWLPRIQKFLPHSWVDSNLVTDKAVKRDDAGVPTHLWDKRCTLVLPYASPALDLLRKLILRVAVTRMFTEFRLYLVETYGQDWLSQLHNGRQRAAQRRSQQKRKRTRGEGDEEEKTESYEELVRDILAGVDAISRFADSDWWSWKRGSSLFFWRWPKGEQRTSARDGMTVWVKSRLPIYDRRARPPDPSKKLLIAEKLQKILDRGYVVFPEEKSFIKSLMDFFDVEKGSDIRMVYNGTSCGLNDVLWAPNFWLPYPATAARLLSYGYYMVDIDLGEMFLNFPLPKLLKRYSGVDLTPYAEELHKSREPKKPLSSGRQWVHWTRCWMGLKPSPFMAIRFYYLAEEFARGNRWQKDNPLRWDRILLNLPGATDFDPTMPRVMKWDELIKNIAGDIVAFVDDLRASGHSVERAWAISRQVVARLQYLGLQDAPRKRRPPVRTPGAWAGSIFTTTENTVLQSISQEKWDKVKAQLKELLEVFLSSVSPLFNYKRLEQIRGFLCHVAMTYALVTPYLKGLHLTLAAHHAGRDGAGWKLTPREWSAYLYEAVETGKMSEVEADSMRDAVEDTGPPDPMSSPSPKPLPKPPLTVAPVERLEDDVKALTVLFSKDEPTQKLIRASRVYTILYGFADASGSGFGSTVLGEDGIRYRIGTWDSDTQESSSNFREFENVVEALKEEAKQGHLRNALIFLCTDNSTVEAALVKGNSSSKKLFDLVLEVRRLEMHEGAQIVVSHVSGERMKAQGTDGVSRGQLKEGVSIGADMLSFIPFQLSAIQRSPAVEDWIRSWLGEEAELLKPEGWFERGHGLLGGKIDSKGFWRHHYKPGKFIWAPPPAAASVAIEELRKARIKRQDSMHVIVIPRLLKPEWFRQLYKAADLVFDVPPGAHCWTKCMYEPLIIGVVFPYLRNPPWQLRLTPKMCSLERDMRRMWKEPGMDPGDLLCKFLLVYERLRTMPADVVRRVLFFESRCPLPCEATSDRRRRKRKRSTPSTTNAVSMGQEATTSR